jgi:cell division transport system permease protein
VIVGRRDVPLDNDASARFLPWLIGFMVYLAALALAAAIAVSNLTERWDKGLSDQVTVQVPPDIESDGGKQDARVNAALEVLRGKPSVRRASLVEPSRMRELLEPWLGSQAATGDLPLPSLIAVTVDRGDPPDLDTLRAELREAAPGATLDDHQRTLGRLLEIAHSLQLLAMLVVALIAGAAVVTVVFVTRTGLAVHRQVIELLHLIGARDGYVASQFQRHALRLGLAGGVAGLALAAATLFGLSKVFENGGETAVVPDLSFGPLQWAMLGATPVAAALVAMLTARFTVLRTLARLS